MTDTQRDLLSERKKTHGEFRDVSSVSQGLKRIAAASPNWPRMPTYQREGVEMILHKFARVLCGDCSYIDHFDDVVGYAVLVRDRLREDESRVTINEEE